jgi:hypothetical protein
MIWRLLTRGEPLLNDSFLFKKKIIIIIIIIHPCMKTLRGMPGGMFCENQLMLVHDMLKKKKKKRRALHGFMMVMSGSF